MIAVFIAAGLMQQTMASDQAGGRLDVPPAIRPWVTPYADCVVRRVNARMPVRDQEEGREALQDATTGCADLRQRGFGSADAALRRTGRYPDSSARRAVIDNAFDQVTRAYEPLFQRLSPRQESLAIEGK